MSLRALEQLVTEARGLAGDHPCQSFGHEWAEDGGRRCPRGGPDDCCQAVYVCERCGQHDYGEQGGPGWNDCRASGCTPTMPWIDPHSYEEWP